MHDSGDETQETLFSDSIASQLGQHDIEKEKSWHCNRLFFLRYTLP